MVSSIAHENIELNPEENQIESFVCNSCQIQRTSSLNVKPLTDGLSNLLFAVRSSEDHGVIVKIYGKNSDLIVDRQMEIQFMIYLAQFHLAPPIILTFKNGFIYRYVPGTPLQNGNEEKALVIARTLAKFHSVPLMDHNIQGQLVEKLRHYINLLSGTNDQLYRRIKLSSSPFLNDLPWSKIRDDIDQIERIIQDPTSIWSKLTIVICHNDTQCLNFLADDGKITLIDFEHGARNFWLYDVYDHFLEYAGCDQEEPDFDGAYPTREKQKKWLTTYLSRAEFLNGKLEKTMTIDELCDLGDQLRTPIHLYWALWAFLEALVNPESMNKFNYVKYGKCRLNEYEKHKNEFFSSIKH